MNQQVRKIIKSSFCPKEKWVPDNSVENCFKCDYRFRTLFRRKHHCRYCGQIFCSKCSNFFFEGKDIGQQEKQIRMCHACYQKCWKYLKKHDENYVEYRKSNDGSCDQIPQALEQLTEKKVSTFTQRDKLTQISSIIKQYTKNDLEGLKTLEEDADKKFTILLQVILKQKKIPLKYLPKILEIAKGVVARSPPNALVTNNMDICLNIKFKCFKAQDFQIKLSNEVLVKRYYFSKKIKDSYENINCILVYGGLQSADLVGGVREASFESIINNRTREMTKMISYCERIGVNFIFLQGSIEKEFDDKFLDAGITVIPKTKIEHICKIKVALDIEKIVESIDQLPDYTKQEIVGKIEKLTTIQFTSFKDPTKCKKFYSVKSIRDDLGMTVFLMGQDRQLLQTMKKEFNTIIMLLRHLHLKIHKVLLDQNLLNSMPEQLRNHCYLNNPQMFFSFYNEHHADIMNYMKERYLSYKYISYTSSDFQLYPQVNKINLQEYLKNRTHSFRNRWDYFTDICGEIQDQHRMFYSQYDSPLGVYVLKKFTLMDKKCNKCHRPNNLHIDLFYSTDHFVKVWTESRIHYENWDTQDNQNFIQYNDMEVMFQQLSKQSDKAKMECFIQCEKCQELLSDKIKLSREHLQYSMVAFLNHFFKGTTKTIIRQNNQKPKNTSKAMICDHADKIRVFSMGDKTIKIYVGSYCLNRLLILTDSGKQNFLNKKQSLHCHQYCAFQINNIEKIVNFLLDQMKSIAEGSKISKFDKIVNDPKASFINARKSILACSNVKLSQAECLDMILPEIVEELKKINEISNLLLNPKKFYKFFEFLSIYHSIINLLKKSYVIITELKKSLKKRQLEMKFQASDFEKDFLMDDIDLSSIADSSSMGEFNDTQSQITKGEQLSTNYDFQKSQNTYNYDWLQPSEEPLHMSRSDRKTVYNRREEKASEEQVTKTFKEISSCYRVQHAFLKYVPAFPHQPQTLIASALNSQIHKECIESSAFTSSLIINMSQYLQNEHSTEHEQIRKLQIMIEIQQRMFDIANKVKKIHSKQNGYDINLLYPNQFEQLRRKNKIPLQLFIQSVGGAQSWLASGGKSGSAFMRSFNDLLVIKKVTYKQFNAFQKFLPKYFAHLRQGSLLVPIYGAFIVTRISNNNNEYFIVMQNLFFGMKNWYLYDFKGSVNRRFSKWPVIPLDVNFLIDRNSQPIFCKDNVLKHLGSTLDYLCDNNIVDYSLILVVQIENQENYYMDGNRFHIGIVDYLRQFGAMQRVQRTWKGQEATVQEPYDYKDRLYRNLKRYFTQIPL